MENCLPQSYLDIPDREWALNTDTAKYLLNLLPPHLQEHLKSYFLDNPFDNKQDLIQYFIHESSMFSITKNDPGSSIAFEFLYTKQVASVLDNYFIKCKSGHQIYKRLIALEDNLPGWLDSILTKKASLLVDNVGSGTGRDIINVISKNPEYQDSVYVRNIDPDSEAMQLSRMIAEEHNVAGNISFLVNTLMDVEPCNADLILLIGILCPLSIRKSRQTLKFLQRLFNNEGIVIYSTALHKMVIDDPLTDSLMRLCGWHMSYKTEQESVELAESLGWSVLGTFFDEPYHHHCMVVAKTKPTKHGNSLINTRADKLQ